MRVSHLVLPVCVCVLAASFGRVIAVSAQAPGADALVTAEIQSLMNLPVDENPGFQVIVYNDPVTIGLSDTGLFNLGIAPGGGFTGWVFPTLAGLPPDTTAAFEPPDGPPHPGPFALAITTGPAVPEGTYSLTTG